MIQDKSYDFYEDVLRSLIGQKVLDRKMRILVSCAGMMDKTIFAKVGFENVVISNLDTRMKGHEFAPYEWSFQDLEGLNYKDGEFDFAVVHSGLHHCSSPHRGMLELYRVARKGILIFEPYDNPLTRLGTKLDFGQQYELSAVYYNDCKFGGLKNTAIPNYAYRLSESEIEKSINCFAPYGKHRFQYFRKMRVPWEQLKNRKNKIFFYAVVAALPILALISKLVPWLSNNFAALVLKPDLPRDMHPWLKWDGQQVQVNAEWLGEKYNPLK